MKKFAFSLLFLISFIALPNFIFSEDLFFTADVGSVFPQGDASDAYETFNPFLAVSGFYQFNSSFSAGLRIGYIKLDPKWEDASASIIEFVPSARFYASNGGFFGQAGLGFFHSEVEFESSYVSYSSSDTDFGINLGVGFEIGKKKGTKFEVLALYNNIFTEGDDFRYVSLGLGIKF